MSPSMSVVHVSCVHPASDPRIFEKECTSLSRAGYDVRLIATGTPPPESPIPVLLTPKPARRMLRMTGGAAMAVLKALRTRAATVHLHDPELALWIPLLRLAGRHVIFDSHEDLPASMDSKDYVPRPLRAAITVACRMLVRFIDRSASGVVCATPAIATSFKNPQTRVVQNYPVLQSLETTSPSSPGQALVYVGGLSHLRGALHMLDSLAILVRTHPDARLTIAGRMDDALLREMEAHPAWSSVTFVGMLDRRGVEELLLHSDVGLVMFQPAGNQVRSQPTKLFEYMAAALPVVASDFPLWREFVTVPETGLVADPLDPAASASAIARLLDDRELARSMGSRGRELVEQSWNWDHEAQELVSLYRALSS